MNFSKIFFILVAGILFFILTGCKKSIDVEEKPVKTMDDLVVAPSFNWETTKEIHVTIGVNLPGAASGLLSRIFTYLGNPYEGGKLLITGSAGYEYPFTAIPDSHGAHFPVCSTDYRFGIFKCCGNPRLR
ncbi:MAG: hypothetical protein V2A67_00875 [Bacteroidota bacterium]